MTNLSTVVTFAIVLLASGGSLVEASSGHCRLLDPCRCEFDDGTGIDIRQVVTKVDDYLTTVDAKTLDKYYFHPCSDIKYLPNVGVECSSGDGYSLCRFNNATQKYENLGLIKDSSFHTDGNGQQFLVYQRNSVQTSIQLLCLKHDNSYLFVDQDQVKLGAGNETTLFLFSPYACPVTIEVISKPSTGGVLLILFLIGTFTYFTIGSIVRFMYLGARGIEVIPNLDFWKDLPGLVRDGVRFLQDGCRVERRQPDPDSYDAI